MGSVALGCHWLEIHVGRDESRLSDRRLLASCTIRYAHPCASPRLAEMHDPFLCCLPSIRYVSRWWNMEIVVVVVSTAWPAWRLLAILIRLLDHCITLPPAAESYRQGSLYFWSNKIIVDSCCTYLVGCKRIVCGLSVNHITRHG